MKKISQVFGGTFLREAGDLVDRFVTTKAERAQFKAELQRMTMAHKEKIHSLYNENSASARQMQEHALAQSDRFAKRFVYYLAALWSVAGILYVFLITFTEVISERSADTVLGFLMGTIVSTIINYFYGSALPADAALHKKTPSSNDEPL